MRFAGFAALIVLLGGAEGTYATDEAKTNSTPAPIDTSTSRPGDASIPFADHGGINDWRADKTRGIWVQSTSRKWFYGTFMIPCTGLDQSEAVGFVTSPSGDLDHWSYIVIRGTVPCHFASFTTSEAPPGRE